MAVRPITYDLNKEPDKHDYSGFYDYIKKHSWARLSESSYAIVSDASPEVIFAALEEHIDADDWVLVMTLTKPYHGQNSKEVVEWLAKYL